MSRNPLHRNVATICAALAACVAIFYFTRTHEVSSPESPAELPPLDISLLEKEGLDSGHARRVGDRFASARQEFETAVEKVRATHGTTAHPGYIAARDRLAARLQAELGP